MIEPKNIIAVRFNLKDWYVAFSADYVAVGNIPTMMKTARCYGLMLMRR